MIERLFHDFCEICLTPIVFQWLYETHANTTGFDQVLNNVIS